MKKLGKSLSFLTKIMLVIGLLISNLSSLSIVFASEVTIDISVVDEKLNIKYLDELADEVETVKVNVYENYTYLDETYYEDAVTSEKGRVSSYEISFKELEELVDTETENTEMVSDGTEMETDDVNSEVVVENTEKSVVDEGNTTEIVNESVDVENALEAENTESDSTVLENVDTDEELTEDKEISLVVDSILSNIVFDGRYDVKVEIVDTTDVENEEIIATHEYNVDVLHESGLELSVVDAITGEKLELLDDGKYKIDYTSPKVRVVARILAGGFGPMDMLSYNGTDYFAKDLVGLEFSSEMDFSGRLYGDYTVPVAAELEKYNRDTEDYELIEIPEEDLVLNVLYGTYDLNTLAMNAATEELTLDKYYMFDGDSKDGVVYVLLDKTKINTMLDLYNIANYMFNEDEYITFDLSNSEYQNIISTFDETTATMSLTNMLANINLDDNVVLSLINDGLTVTYRVVVAGDNNNDNLLTKEDLLDLIEQVLGNKDVNLEKSDLYGIDGNVNALDVMYLDQVIKNDNWDLTLMEDADVSIDSELKVVEADIVSGEKFTVDYIVKLSDYAINGVGGLFKYDDSVLALESIDVVNEWLGNNKDGQFLYIGEESLALPVVEDTDSDVTDSEIPETDENLTDVPVGDEVVAGDTNIELDDTLTDGEIADENTEDVMVTEDYVVVKAVFTALKSGTHTINVENSEYFNQLAYYGVEDTPISVDVVVNASDNNNLSSLTVAGQVITLVDNQLDYEITVGNDVTVADVEAIVENVAANITSIVSPEELVEGENIVTITVTSESGDVKVYTVKVIREAAPEEEKTTQVNYNNYYETDDEDDNDAKDNVVVTEPEEDTNDDDKKVEEESDLSRIVIIILILLVIAGLIYLIFKDEDDDETKKTNKEVNKLKKEVKEPEIKKEIKSDNKPNNKVNNKTNNKNSNGKNKNSKNKKKDR